MAPAIPDRWTAYKACGKVIEGTKFICFKVPLRKNIQINNKEITEIWDIPTLLSRIPNLGAVIDLTNTSRYYNPLEAAMYKDEMVTTIDTYKHISEFKNSKVRHKKILIPGRIIPPDLIIKQFMKTVDRLLGEIGDSLIGVHCTHGLNRTGFMVCRYMRDRMGISGSQALKRFEKARGYQIERENYIADILGKKPPPPQFGPGTKVKPLEEENQKHLEDVSETCDSDSSAEFSIRYSSIDKPNGNHQGRESSSKCFKYDYRRDY